jgi:hypothetical protein
MPKTDPSGKILMICFPIMRDELCKMLAGRTLFSEIDNSLSKTVLMRKSSHPSIGSFIAVSKVIGIQRVNVPVF